MLKANPCWDIIDSSKISDYLTCPRLYFYRHVLGWRKDVPAHDLVFGEAWHKAREHQLLNGYDDIQGAYAKFMNYYRQYFDVETDEIYQPKTPEAAIVGLMQFAEQRSDDLRDNEVLLTETSGTVPIDFNGRKLHYRMDSVIRRKEDDRIFSWDHKSAKSFSRVWSDKFILSVQNGTYTHCMYCMYPQEQVLGVEFCGTSFEYLKRGSKARPQGYHVNFLRVPAWKTPEQMNTWLWNTLETYKDIERDMDHLHHCKEDDLILTAFKLNPESCTKYWGCAYHDYCITWANPLQHADEPPLGFRVEFWDPSAMETTNKKDLDWERES